MTLKSFTKSNGFVSASLLLGLLLQCCVPLLDGELMYRFSNWVSVHTNIDASQLELIRQEVRTVEELSRLVEMHHSDEENGTTSSDSILEYYLVAADARKQSQQTAAEIRIMQQIQATLVGKLALSQVEFLSKDPVLLRKQSQMHEKERIREVLSYSDYFRTPPLSGQSSLAP